MANIIQKIGNWFESRNSLENPNVPLSLGLAAVGLGMPTSSNEYVTEKTSLEVPTVLACVRILSEGVGSLPLRIYEELPVRGRRLAKEHPLYRLLTLEPNPDSTAVNLLTTLMVHAVLWQKAFCEIERNSAGQPIALYPRLPWLTKPIRQNGVLYFSTTDTQGGHERIIKADDMLHIVGFSVDGISGMSLIQLARQSIGLSMAAAKYGARFFANNARPGGVIELTNPLSPEDMTRLRLDIEAMQSGVNTHRVAVMPPGMKWNTISVNPVESEYIAVSKFTVCEIAAMMRVPGYMVGALEKVLKSTVEAQNSEFLSFSLRPWLERFEQEFMRKLLPLGRNAGKYTLRFFVDELLRADLAARNAGYTAGITGGWLCPDDVCELEGRPPIKGGDVYRAPLNMGPIGEDDRPLDTEDDGEPDDNNSDDNKAKAARAIFLPLLQDAIGRMRARSKKDAAACRTAFSPLIASFRTYLGRDKLVPEDYFDGLAARCTTWTDESAQTEFNILKENLQHE